MNKNLSLQTAQWWPRWLCYVQNCLYNLLVVSVCQLNLTIPNGYVSKLAIIFPLIIGLLQGWNEFKICKTLRKATIFIEQHKCSININSSYNWCIFFPFLPPFQLEKTFLSPQYQCRTWFIAIESYIPNLNIFTFSVCATLNCGDCFWAWMYFIQCWIPWV